MKLKSVITGTAIFALLMTNSYADEGRSLFVNDVQIPEAGIFESDDTVMIPLRKICEALGMDVQWEGESGRITISKGPVYITCTPYSDGYTFAKSGPHYLGHAPVLVDDGTTYVPAAFAKEILKMDVSTTELEIKLSEKTYTESNPSDEEAENEKENSGEEEVKGSDVVLTEVSEGRIEVYDLVRGTVVLNITDETELVDEDGNKIDAETLEKGCGLSVTYADFMTLSLPPMTNGVKIVAKSEGMYDVVTGTVCMISDEEGHRSITIGDKDDINTQTVFNVGDDLYVMDTEGNKVDFDAIKEGMKLDFIASAVSTRSIPPQQALYAARISGENA